MRNFFRDVDVVGFVNHFNGAYNTTRLVTGYTYPHTSNQDLAQLLPALIGSAKAYAALELLRRLFYKTESPVDEPDHPELIAALDALVVVYSTSTNPSGAADAAGVLHYVPLKLWETHLAQILTHAVPYWRTKFALDTLARDANHQLAAATVAAERNTNTINNYCNKHYRQQCRTLPSLKTMPYLRYTRS